jgi:hypothetical protein
MADVMSSSRAGGVGVGEREERQEEELLVLLRGELGELGAC